ncbi:hypothetical protein [Holdemanella biformis]|uniref:hypothetical protein n=1 Tax=Holdemanella biformis TaxID=1735 RepID=UPI0026DED05B|nr:hypothetical protein [Holdemanella biformis]
MGRRNFFDRLARTIDFQREYQKIESLVLQPHSLHGDSIEDSIERYFKNWKYNANYLSFKELRDQLKFTFVRDGYYDVPSGHIKDANDFFDYCEMIINMIVLLPEEEAEYHENNVNEIIRLIDYDLNSLNHKIRKIDDKYLIIQKDATVSEVVDIVEVSLAKIILEYNHYLLKGDLEKKKNILVKIANALEPQKSEIKAINYQLFKDYFYLINNMDIRHNNCDSSDTSNYNAYFDKLTIEEKEEWYDEIYQMSLLIFLLLENRNRTKKISDLKSKYKR